jgi:hypothetical protein
MQEKEEDKYSKKSFGYSLIFFVFMVILEYFVVINGIV